MIQDYHQRARHIFDTLAKESQGHYDTPISHYVQQRVRKHVLAMLHTRSETVLDAGCGRGDVSVLLANHFPQARITGVDFSTGMLHVGMQQSQELGLGNISFYAADLRHLPFADQAFTATLCINTLTHFPRKSVRQPIAELARVTHSEVVIEIKNNLSPIHIISKARLHFSRPELLIYGTNLFVMKRMWQEHGFKLATVRGVLGPSLIAPIMVLCFQKNL